jgi:hypothetical protein
MWGEVQEERFELSVDGNQLDVFEPRRVVVTENED